MSFPLSLDSRGARVDLVVRIGGDSYETEYRLQNEDGSFVDLSGAVVQAQIRQTFADVAPAASFVASVTDERLRLSLPAAAITGLQGGEDEHDPAGRYRWDCLITFPDTQARWIAWGEVRVLAANTQ